MENGSLDTLYERVNFHGGVVFRRTEGKGYGAFATRDIKAGSVVLEEAPLCTWEEGRLDPCTVLQTQVLSSPPSLAVMGLMSPYEPPAWLPCDLAFSALADRYTTAGGPGGPSPSPKTTPSELARLVLVLESNAFPLGLYSAAAKVNHTCARPNCRAFQDKASGSLVLEAVGDIGQGEELSLSYLDAPVLPPRRERQRRLQATYHFTCACALCTLGEGEEQGTADIARVDSPPAQPANGLGERTKDTTATMMTGHAAHKQQEEEQERDEACAALEGLACPQCLTGLLRPRRTSCGPSVGPTQEEVASPIGAGAGEGEGKGTGSRGWGCGGCGAWASDAWAGAAVDRVDALHHKVASLDRVKSDARGSLARLLALHSQAARLCHARHVLLASLHHALLTLLSSPRLKGPLDEQMLRDAGLYASELKATMRIYMPTAHPDLLAVDQTYEAILTLRRKTTKPRLGRKLPEKALLEVLKVDELSMSAAVSA